MTKSSKAKYFVWILSLTLGPVVYFILLLVLPGMLNMASMKENISVLMTFWSGGFVLVWAVHWLTKFVVKYGRFM